MLSRTALDEQSTKNVSSPQFSEVASVFNNSAP